MKIKLLLLSIFAINSYCSPINYVKESTVCQKQCPLLNDTRINVHLVPHSHDDVGWLQTLDGYYFGTAGFRTYEHAGVQYIISSTVEALKTNPERRFIQVETAFFWKWWTHQSDSVQQDFIKLVNSGQIEIINGAWSMNDEAASHYQSIIDQFTWGFNVLNHTIGECGKPNIGWQIDPFGHSREHASLLRQMGFDGLIIGRIDYRDKENRKTNKALDFLWKTSANLENSNLFTSMFPDIYTPVGGFCFDITCQDAPINSDPDSPENNLQTKVDEFSSVMDTYATYYQTKNILIPMGGDFHFQAAEINFINIDRLIQGFANHEKYHVFYSTPSCYIKAVNDELLANSLTLPEKSDDFFPYASDSHAFWTGYFTSRPSSKRFERLGNNILQAAKQLASFFRINEASIQEDLITSLRQAMGVLQHHDAITGTEKQFVANDYARILYKGMKSAEEQIVSALSKILQNDGENVQELGLSLCLRSNVSICEPSNYDRFMVAVYNPLGRTVSHYVRLPSEEGVFKITGPDGAETYDLTNSISNFDYLTDAAPSTKELVFKARNIPPLGAKVYFVEKQTSLSKSQEVERDDVWEFGTDYNGFTIDETTHLLKTVKIRGQNLNIKQEFLSYTPFIGDSERSSGAYVFRPTTDPAQTIVQSQIQITSFIGNLVDEFKQIINGEVTQIIRVYKEDGDDYIEFDWLIGDLIVDLDNRIGREIVTRYTIEDLINNGIFYTDSNGREQIRRERNKRSDYEYDPTEEPASSNYYPVTSKIVVQDEEKNIEVAVLVDRAEGGSSLEDGSIELMLHRRLLRDDYFGVEEALNEIQFDKGLYVRGQHLLTFGSFKNNSLETKSTPAWERELVHRKLLAPLVLIKEATSDDEWQQLHDLINMNVTGLIGNLPDNVHLLTLEPWNDNTYLIRLEHVLEKNEDETLSAPAIVNLTEILPFIVTQIQETTLGANQILDENADLTYINLNPMEIKTFIVTIPVIYNEN